MTDKTIEIDGFGVLEEFQHQGIGSEIQAYVGHMANEATCYSCCRWRRYC